MYTVSNIIKNIATNRNMKKLYNYFEDKKINTLKIIQALVVIDRKILTLILHRQQRKSITIHRKSSEKSKKDS